MLREHQKEEAPTVNPINTHDTTKVPFLEYFGLCTREVCDDLKEKYKNKKRVIVNPAFFCRGKRSCTVRNVSIDNFNHWFVCKRVAFCRYSRKVEATFQALHRRIAQNRLRAKGEWRGLDCYHHVRIPHNRLRAKGEWRRLNYHHHVRMAQSRRLHRLFPPVQVIPVIEHRNS